MKSTIVIASLFVIALAGCNTNMANVRIKKKVSLIRPEDSTTYTYSMDGTITSIHVYPSTLWSSYQYVRNKVVEQCQLPNPYSRDYYLNATGLTERMVVDLDTVSYCFHYAYDENGYMVSVDSGCDTRTLEMKRIIKDGNIAKVINYNNGTEQEVIYNEYDIFRPNVIGYFNTGFNFMGQDSRNLLTRSVTVRNGNDTVSVNLHSYHFDYGGRVTVEAIYNKAGALADSVQYFY